MIGVKAIKINKLMSRLGFIEIDITVDNEVAND
jgi:hypothetical protein